MTYELYVNTMSPYSIKASALLGYAGIPCKIVRQNLVTRFTVLKRLTGKTMVPVLRRGEWAINDSTEIARWAVGETDQSLLPAEQWLHPICWLLEEFADEWVSRWMVQSRWCNPEDADYVGEWIGEELTGDVPCIGQSIGAAARRLITKGLARGGARDSNRPALEQSRDRTLQALENLFDESDGFLFGPFPTVADFSLYGQIEQYRRDPTGGRRMEMYPAISEWLDVVDRMRLPHPVVALRHDVDFREGRLDRFFAEFFGTYWRVVVAIHRARASGADSDDVEVELVDGTTFRCYPSRYMAGRIEFVLGQLEALYRSDGELLETRKLQIREAVEGGIERLAGYEAGARMLQEFPRLSEVSSRVER